MTYPVLLFVDTAIRAAAIQRDHDPEILQVLRIGDSPGVRASSIIIENPRPGVIKPDDFNQWMAWVPTRLEPGDRHRITII